MLHVQADSLAPVKFTASMARIDERAEAILRDARGFSGQVLKRS